jgi:hypothetical protein
MLEAQGSGSGSGSSGLSVLLEYLPLILVCVALYVVLSRLLRGRHVDWDTILLVSGVAVFLIGLGIIVLRDDIVPSLLSSREFRGSSSREVMEALMAWGGFLAVAGATAFTVGLIRLIKSRRS